MRSPSGRFARFVAASLAVHALAFVWLATRPPLPPRAPRAITVEVVDRTAPPSAPPASPAPIAALHESAPAPRPVHPHVADARPAHSPVVATPPVPPPSPSPEPTPDPARSAEPTTPRKPIDLFNARALGAAIGASGTLAVPDPRRGVTHSAAAGDRDPNARDGSLDKEEAAGRVGEFLAEAGSAERIKSGNVPPKLFDAARSMRKAFHPSAVEVSDDNAISGFLHSWMQSAAAASGPAARGVDESRSGFNGFGGPGAGATMEHGEIGRTRTVVEVVSGPDGKIISARVVSRSARRRYDQQALEAVKKAVEQSGAFDEKQVVVTRWAVEAWLDVTPPSPGASLSFDEVTGKVAANYPLKKDVKVNVDLIFFAKR